MKKSYSISNASSFVEIGFSICILIWVFKYYSTDGMVGERGDFDNGLDQLETFVYNVVEETNREVFRFDILLAILTGLFWLKVMLLLKLTRSFGPLLKIIEKMVYDFAYFCVIWGINLMFFSFLGMLLFSELEIFKSF